MPDWRIDSRIGRYGLAVLAVLAAALCRWGLVTLGLTANTTFGPFYAALVVATLYGGVGAGVVALALSAAVTVACWATEPARSTIVPAALVVFLVVGALVVWLSYLTRLARLRAERAEHRVQTCLDSIGDAFVAVDFSWRYTYVNEAAQAYFSKTEAELIGRNCWEVFPQVLGTPLEMYYRQVMAQRQRVTVELPSVLHAGKVAQLLVSPTAEGISVVFRDITEGRRLREALLRHQERLHRALEAAHMAAWEYDPRANRVTYSASATDVLGIPVEHLPTDRRSGTDLIHADDREAHVERVRHAARTADGQYRSTYRLADEYLFGRQGPLWFEERGRIFFDVVGQLTLVQGVLQDVTAQRATQERIRALNEDLHERIAERQALLEAAEASREVAERSSRAKDEFLAVLSHELRSPMQSVLGWVQVLRSTPMEADASRRALDTIERNLRQQTQLINDMLDVSRIVTGKLVFHLATLPLGSVVRETIDELGPQAQAKGLDVQLTIDGDLLVVADRERVRQVVSNLFTNAVKFTPAGGAVHLSCVECAGMAQFDVRDTGDGIAAGLLPNIFERFRQADTSSTRQHEGLGLGLAITKYIVDHLGGTITAASPGAGQGACFSVRLPFAGTKRADDARPGPPAAFPHERPIMPPAPAAGRLAGLDVLVVDDHRDTVELIAFVLVREGAAVRTAMSAREALAAWQTQPADVLVTDLSMPGMDGFALLGALGGSANVPAIALSGLARADDRQRALQAGFAAHLAKPVEPAVLVETIARINEGRLTTMQNSAFGIQN